MSLGTVGLDYVIENGRAGYFPMRTVEGALADGAVHLVPDAPAFPFPTYVVWQIGVDNEETIAEAVRLLRRVAEKVDDEQIEAIEEAEIEIADDELSGGGRRRGGRP